MWSPAVVVIARPAETILPVFVEAMLPTVPGVPDLTTTVSAGCVASVVPAAFFTTTAIVAACAVAANVFATTVAESEVVVATAVEVSPVDSHVVDLAADATRSSAGAAVTVTVNVTADEFSVPPPCTVGVNLYA